MRLARAFLRGARRIARRPGRELRGEREPALEMVERIGELARATPACRATQRRPRSRARTQVAVRIGDGRRGGARCRAARARARARGARSRSSLARLLVRVLAEPAPLRVAEDVGEEHLGVVAVGLEQHDVGVRVTARWYCSMPDLHARMDDRAEGLRRARAAGRPRSACRGAAARCARRSARRTARAD